MEITADGTVQQKFCPVKNKIQFTKISKKLSCVVVYSQDLICKYAYVHIYISRHIGARADVMRGKIFN